MEETLKYQRRFEEGYDIPDPRYQRWLALYHPEAKMPSKNSSGRPPPHQRSMVHPPQTSLSKFLKISTSTPKHKLSAKEPKNLARILTSAESQHILKEKKNRIKRSKKQQEKREHMKAAKLMKAMEA